MRFVGFGLHRVRMAFELPSSVRRTFPEPARRGCGTLTATGIRAIDNVTGIVVKTPGTVGACPDFVSNRRSVEIGTQAAAMDRGVRISRPSRRYQSRFGTWCASVEHILVRRIELERSRFLNCRLAERGRGGKSAESD